MLCHVAQLAHQDGNPKCAAGWARSGSLHHAAQLTKKSKVHSRVVLEGTFPPRGLRRLRGGSWRARAAACIQGVLLRRFLTLAVAAAARADAARSADSPDISSCETIRQTAESDRLTDLRTLLCCNRLTDCLLDIAAICLISLDFPPVTSSNKVTDSPDWILF